MGALRAHLIAELFLDAPEERSGLSRRAGVALLAGLLALAIGLQLARLGRASALNTIWAEDGHIFLQEALTKGPLDALTTTYGTYLVLAPRLLAELAALAPLRDAAAAISILAAATVALSGAVVWVASAAHIRSRLLRGALVVLTVLTPVAGVEAVASASYVLWYMLFASFWILLWRPRGWGGAVFASLFILVTALTTPGVWFLAPVAALRAIAARDRRDLLILCAYAAGALTQIPVVLLSNDVAPAAIWTSDIWVASLQRLVAETPLGLDLAGSGWEHLGWGLIVVVAVAGAAGLALGLRRAGTHARWIAGLAVPIAIAMFVASIYQRGAAGVMVWDPGTYNFLGSRYVIVPSLLLISTAFVLLDRRSRAEPERPALIRARIAVVALLGLALVGSFWVRDLTIRGTPWKAALQTAEAECAAGKTNVVIPTAPPGWAIELPCPKL